MMDQTKFCYDDFDVGKTVDLVGSHTVTLEEIVAFAEEFDPQPMHLSDVKIPGMDQSGPIASGWFTCSISTKLMCAGYLRNSHCMGSPGMDSIKWHKPVLPGDVLRLRLTCEAARISKSRPEMGICTIFWEMLDQNDEPVMDLRGLQLFRTRASLGEQN